jgi:hypothetical protein
MNEPIAPGLPPPLWDLEGSLDSETPGLRPGLYALAPLGPSLVFADTLVAAG